MKIPFVSRQTGEHFFDLDMPFMEWRACKKAARKAGLSLDDWFEHVIREGIAFEKSLRRRQRFLKLKLDKLEN